METILYIKNMVCDRCKMAVGKILRDAGLAPVDIELGMVRIEGEIDAPMHDRLAADLAAIGFELLDDRHQQIIEQIRSAVIRLVHYRDNQSSVNLSDYLSRELHSDYSALSRLFSEFAGKTIERYYIEQRIERVKELIFYDELSLTQIAYRMNYSSVAYLSSQFKSVTGMTPSQFKALKNKPRKPLDKV